MKSRNEMGSRLAAVVAGISGLLLLTVAVQQGLGVDPLIRPAPEGGTELGGWICVTELSGGLPAKCVTFTGCNNAAWSCPASGGGAVWCPWMDGVVNWTYGNCSNTGGTCWHYSKVYCAGVHSYTARHPVTLACEDYKCNNYYWMSQRCQP